MAIIKRGILGGFSNKIANVVGSSWKGIAVMRALPLSVANPKTPKQTAQREKFANISFLASEMLSGWVKPLWDRQSKKMSGYNNFVSHNIKYGDSMQDLQYGEMVWSKGILPAVDKSIVTVLEENVNVQWVAEITDPLESPDDLVYIAIIRVEDWHVAAISSGIAKRRDQEFSFVGLTDWLQGNYVCLIAFANADGSRVSATHFKTFQHTQ